MSLVDSKVEAWDKYHATRASNQPAPRFNAESNRYELPPDWIKRIGIILFILFIIACIRTCDAAVLFLLGGV